MPPEWLTTLLDLLHPQPLRLRHVSREQRAVADQVDHARHPARLLSPLQRFRGHGVQARGRVMAVCGDIWPDRAMDERPDEWLRRAKRRPHESQVLPGMAP
mgnify:CR=1 FL=1